MPTGAADVLLLSGSSFVSIDGAERNLRNATPDPGSVGSTLDGAFTAMVAHSKASWERRFSAIQIEAEPSTRRLLYTSLYHSMLAPRIYSDADGEYPAFNMHATTARARGWTYFSDFSA
jgi:putative alpha-1,2-mannosidase